MEQLPWLKKCNNYTVCFFLTRRIEAVSVDTEFLSSFHVRMVLLYSGHVGWMKYFILQIMQLKRGKIFFFLQYKKPSSSTFFTVNLPKHPHSEFVNNVPQFTLPFQSLVFNFLPVLSVIYLLIWQIFILCAGIYFMHWEKIVKTYLFPTSIELEVSLWWNLNLL